MDKSMITINKLELASELADRQIMIEFECRQVNVVELNGDVRYTEEAQEVFNELYDEYMNLIERFEVKDV